MKKHRQITKKELITSIITWLMFILVYWISLYELCILCRLGRVKKSIFILVGCTIFFLIWFIILIIGILKRPKVSSMHDEDERKSYSGLKTTWICAVIIVIAVMTCFYGAKIYHTATNFNGKLSWFLKDLKDKRTIEFEHNNIYKSGIDGIFTDINKKISMPEKLYVASSFSLKFDSHGKITSFDTYLYGKDDNGSLKSYLISYDSSKSEKITIYLNGHVNADYKSDKLLEPLIKTMKVIPLKKTVEKWNENQYGILYYGRRSFGYNAAGVVYIDPEGNMNSNANTSSEIAGYFVSVYVPGKENQYIPVRYVLVDNVIKNNVPL